MAVYGVLHFVYAQGVAHIVPVWIPWPLFWTYFVGVALLAAAAAIAFDRLAFLAATLLGVMILLFVLLIHTSLVFQNPATIPADSMFGNLGGRWNNCFKDLGLCGAAFILAGVRSPRDRTVLDLGRWILALCISAFGILHTIYPAFGPGIQPMFESIAFPLPGHLFWVYLTAAIFLAGGFTIAIRKEERVAALTVAMTILVFDLLTWVPRFGAHPSELWGNWLKDLGVAGGALLLAGHLAEMRKSSK